MKMYLIPKLLVWLFTHTVYHKVSDFRSCLECCFEVSDLFEEVSTFRDFILLQLGRLVPLLRPPPAVSVDQLLHVLGVVLVPATAAAAATATCVLVLPRQKRLPPGPWADCEMVVGLPLAGHHSPHSPRVVSRAAWWVPYQQRKKIGLSQRPRQVKSQNIRRRKWSFVM